MTNNNSKTQLVAVISYSALWVVVDYRNEAFIPMSHQLGDNRSNYSSCHRDLSLLAPFSVFYCYQEREFPHNKDFGLFTVSLFHSLSVYYKTFINLNTVILCDKWLSIIKVPLDDELRGSTNIIRNLTLRK